MDVPLKIRLHFVYCCVTVTISNSSCFFLLNNKCLDIYYNECYWKQSLHFSLNILQDTLVIRFFQFIWAFLGVANKQHAIIEHLLWKFSGPSSYSL